MLGHATRTDLLKGCVPKLTASAENL